MLLKSTIPSCYLDSLIVEVQFVTFIEEVLETFLLIPSFCGCQESICLLCSIWLLFASKANLYYSKEEVLETFAHTVELICRVQNHFVPFKAINWIGSHWRGT